MAIRMMQHVMSALPQLRFEPVLTRVRVRLEGVEVADSTGAVLVWEPMRVVPSYAVPETDISAELTEATPGPPPDFRPVRFGQGGPPLLDPTVPFAVHTAEGQALTVHAGARHSEAAAFRLDDDDVRGLVVLDFDAFDWTEEDEPIVGHPRDPFHRIDVRRSSRRLRIEHAGHVLAESSDTMMLFEGTFPIARYYVPRADVQVELRPGALTTTCAYKGRATHHSAIVGGEELADIAWSYEDPLDDALSVRGLISFYQERLDVFVDDQPLERVRTPWS